MTRTPRRPPPGTGPRDAEAAPAPTGAPRSPARHAEAGAPAPPAAEVPGRLQYAYVNMQRSPRVERRQGSVSDKLKAFQDQKRRELQDKQKTLQAAQQKLESGGSGAERRRARAAAVGHRSQQRDLQRLTEDAQQDVQELAQQVEEEFTRKVLPIIDKVAQEKQVHFVFNAAQSGLVWADPSDGPDRARSSRRMNAAAKPAAAPAAPRPPATPPPTPPATGKVARGARLLPSTSHRSSAASPTAIRRC